jgi:hypothetical protein
MGRECAGEDADGASMSTKHLAMSDTFLQDAHSDAQSMRGRIDCAFEAGYLALLAVLTDDERPTDEHPSVEAIARAYARLERDIAPDVRLAGAHYRALRAGFNGDEREQAVRDARARYLSLLGGLPDDARLEFNVDTAVRLARARYYPAERNDLEAVLAWAEHVRARAKQYLEINDEP